jgi:molybdopterin synthase sulfur carrier subunit
MPVVWIPSLMRSLTDNHEQIVVEGETLRQVIESLEAQYPGIRGRVVEEDRIRPGLAVSINGEVTNEGLRTRIAETDEVHFVAAIGGGS